MNYPGLEALRADVAALSNAMCDVRMMLNRLESEHRHDSASLAGRMAGPFSGGLPGDAGAGREFSGLTPLPGMTCPVN